MSSLLISKHEKYFRLCLNSLPSKAQSEDANKLSIVSFCIQGLDIIGKLNLTDKEKTQNAEFVYSHLIHDPFEEIQSFRASQTFKLPSEVHHNYDLPNLAATFFALSILLALGSDYSKNGRIDRHKIMRFVSKLQIKNGMEKGGFKPVLDNMGTNEHVGESDLRHCYTALCIRKLLKYDELPEQERKHDLDVPLVQSYILERVNFNGGLSSNRYTESHSGLTFCGLASLRLLNYNFEAPENKKWVDHTLRWLVNRQVDYPSTIEAYQNYADESNENSYEYWDENDLGGFNGRENKFGDTCYSWWCTASLKLLGDQYLPLINVGAAQKHLLASTQNKLIGGFGKDSESFPDPFHTYLGLAALALWKDVDTHEAYEGESALNGVDPSYVISLKSREFLDQVIYN